VGEEIRNGYSGSLDTWVLIKAITQSAALMYHKTAILNASPGEKLTAADWGSEF